MPCRHSHIFHCRMYDVLLLAAVNRLTDVTLRRSQQSTLATCTLLLQLFDFIFFVLINCLKDLLNSCARYDSPTVRYKTDGVEYTIPLRNSPLTKTLLRYFLHLPSLLVDIAHD